MTQHLVDRHSPVDFRDRPPQQHVVKPLDVDGRKIAKIFIDGSLTASQQAIFTDAADRLAEIIIGDVPDIFLPGSFFADGIGRNVDDVAIETSAPAIDGVGGILGQAGPTGIRSGSFLPAVGIMHFDSADVAALESSGQLVDVILHEVMLSTKPVVRVSQL